MYRELKYKTITQKLATTSHFDTYDRILNCIELLERTPSKDHNIIKNYIREYLPDVWLEFNREDTIKACHEIIENYDYKEIDKDMTIGELLKKIGD